MAVYQASWSRSLWHDNSVMNPLTWTASALVHGQTTRVCTVINRSQRFANEFKSSRVTMDGCGRQVTRRLKSSMHTTAVGGPQDDQQARKDSKGEETPRRTLFLTTLAVPMALSALFLSHDGQLASASGWFGGEEKDPFDPFIVYGSVYKKFLIEDIVEGKIVGRRKGFTATACINCVPSRRDLNAPPLLGSQSDFSPAEPSCAKGQSATKEGSCETPCRTACGGAIDRHLGFEERMLGYKLDAKDRARALESCSSHCYFECMKAGNTISFELAIRP